MISFASSMLIYARSLSFCRTGRAIILSFLLLTVQDLAAQDLTAAVKCLLASGDGAYTVEVENGVMFIWEDWPHCHQEHKIVLKEIDLVKVHGSCESENCDLVFESLSSDEDDDAIQTVSKNCPGAKGFRSSKKLSLVVQNDYCRVDPLDKLLRSFKATLTRYQY